MPRIAVIGGGITGLAAAWELSSREGVDLVVFERSASWGGKLRATPFAGRPSIDEGPDAFLARVPWGTQLIKELGLTGSLTSPAIGSAFVWWHGRLHPIPDGLMLGVPKGLAGLSRSHLLTWRGKARAAMDLVLPKKSTRHDSLGRTIRDRFGAEVAERLVDPLVGGINAGDADDLSLRAAVPQLVDAATTKRSMLIALRRAPSAAPGPIFFAPTTGIASLAAHLVEALRGRGVELRANTDVEVLEADNRVNGEQFDGVIITTPAFDAGRLLGALNPDAAALLRSIVYAGVVMVTLAVPSAQLDKVPAGSGYLVPKPAQRQVTAVSFGSRKWAHWAHGAGEGDAPTEILRLSLGRHGNQAPLDFDDGTVVSTALAEISDHLRTDIVPTDTRITRWPQAFPQYQPHHLDRLERIDHEMSTTPTIRLAGAAYRGIGVPACIRQGRDAATALLNTLENAKD